MKAILVTIVGLLIQSVGLVTDDLIGLICIVLGTILILFGGTWAIVWEQYVETKLNELEERNGQDKTNM